MFVVSLLSTMNVVAAVDENGKEIYPVPEFTGDMVRFDIPLELMDYILDNTFEKLLHVARLSLFHANLFLVHLTQ